MLGTSTKTDIVGVLDMKGSSHCSQMPYVSQNIKNDLLVSLTELSFDVSVLNWYCLGLLTSI